MLIAAIGDSVTLGAYCRRWDGARIWCSRVGLAYGQRLQSALGHTVYSFGQAGRMGLVGPTCLIGWLGFTGGSPTTFCSQRLVAA